MKSHFKFNKQERSGIFFLLLIIVLLQLGYFVFRSIPQDNSEGIISARPETQAQIDSLRLNAHKEGSVKIYLFNPNFITDYKGYSLGMSVDEIDRLHAFRKQNKYVNSPKEFQKITLVSDSLLQLISPYFKFPEWTQKRKQFAVGVDPSGLDNGNTPSSEGQGKVILDLNMATREDLKTINGIGDKLSIRIIKFRNRLGGFLVDEQLYDVYGLGPEVVQRTLKQFKVLKKPEIHKIDINAASAYEIAKLVYIQKQVAERIVDYRNLNGTIRSFDELIAIEDFPAGKIDRIALYLQL